MQSSSSARRKRAFVPWLAALVFGATAHAGWLIHELDAHEPEPQPAVSKIDIDLDVDIRVDGADLDEASRAATAETEAEARRELARAMRARRRAEIRSARQRGVPSCRHSKQLDFEADDPNRDLDLWITEVERYTYTIDRRVFDQVATADFDLPDLSHLGVIMRGLGLAEPIEMRNIRAGTPLYLLGLRTGDRVMAIATEGEGELERVQVAIERRGRPISLSYELV